MRCPICKKISTWEGNPDRPFCSERCRIIDLGRWSGEEYSISIPLEDLSEDIEQNQDRELAETIPGGNDD